MNNNWYPPEPPRSTGSLEAYLAEHGRLPEPDRSAVRRNRFLSEGQLDLGTWTSTIVHGSGIERPFVVETWAETGDVTCQTLFMSRIGLEDETKESMLGKLRHSAIIECREDTPTELHRAIDKSGHPVWSFTLCIGTGDTLYVTKAFPSEPYPQEAFGGTATARAPDA